MAMPRIAATSPLVALEDKLRATSVLRFRETRITAEGIELEAIDVQTGQVALVTISPVNSGQCVFCSHVSHVDAKRCEAIVTFTKERCGCDPVADAASIYGKFPYVDGDQRVPAERSSIFSGPRARAGG